MTDEPLIPHETHPGECSDTDCTSYTIIDMDLMPLVEATLRQLREDDTDTQPITPSDPSDPSDPPTNR